MYFDIVIVIFVAILVFMLVVIMVVFLVSVCMGFGMKESIVEDKVKYGLMLYSIEWLIDMASCRFVCMILILLVIIGVVWMFMFVVEYLLEGEEFKVFLMMIVLFGYNLVEMVEIGDEI